MPIPVSEMDTLASTPLENTCTVTEPPGLLYLMAFSIRLISICSTRSELPMMFTGSLFRWQLMVTSFSPA